MNKRGLFGIIIIVGILLVAGFFWFVSQYNYQDKELDDAKCVPSSCCHATSCVSESEAPNCSGKLCSMSCEPDTLDCGQAKCEYIDGNCEVVKNE